MTKTFRQAEPLDPRAVDDFLVVRASDGVPLYRVLTYPAAAKERNPLPRRQFRGVCLVHDEKS